KTAAELRKIAEAEAVTEDSMRYARDLLRSAQVNSKGVLTRNGKPFTCDMLRAEIEGFLKQRGCTAEQTITACGEDASQPHNLGSGPLLAGKPIVIDIFPRSDRSGYWGDMTRTFCKGKALPVVRKAFKSVLKASEIAQKMIRAGVCAADVHRAAAESMASDGFLTGHTPDGLPCGFIHGLGHGLGLEIHEGPRVSPVNPNPLAAGNVVSVEPGLYHPSWGGIRLEDIVAVTKDGCHNFNTMEKELELD
ncbi:Xaa-Pro peptidase family protein, partial [bacterium]|nr:Xaa-Pro peptidase family protein [bacterium]